MSIHSSTPASRDAEMHAKVCSSIPRVKRCSSSHASIASTVFLLQHPQPQELHNTACKLLQQHPLLLERHSTACKHCPYSNTAAASLASRGACHCMQALHPQYPLLPHLLSGKMRMIACQRAQQQSHTPASIPCIICCVDTLAAQSSINSRNIICTT